MNLLDTFVQSVVRSFRSFIEESISRHTSGIRCDVEERRRCGHRQEEDGVSEEKGIEGDNRNHQRGEGVMP